jgi:uncharacterized protein involved in copper resistance
MNKLFLLLLVTLLSSTALLAQHEHHQMEKTDTAKPKEKVKPADHSMHDMHDMDSKHYKGMKMDVPMSHAFSLNLPMNPQWFRYRLAARCFSYVWCNDTFQKVDVYDPR